MSAQKKIKTRCPVCNTLYRVPDGSVGHRARCPKCDSVFRVAVPLPEGDPPAAGQALSSGEAPPTPHAPGRPTENSPRHASEDDILRWLMEGADKDELPLEPRWWESPKPPQKASA